jgi:RNA polymerase sigma-70 factor (ECF subfamily)
MAVNNIRDDASNIAADAGMSHQAEDGLVARARDGDEEAFGELVRMYHDRIYALAFNIVRNEHDARDLAQATWIKAWRSLTSFRGQSRFYTWLYRVGTYVCLDHLRRSKARPQDSLDDEDWMQRQGARTELSDRAATPDQNAQSAEIRAAFNRALAELSPEHRTVLVLREVDGLSYDEIADVMECRKGTVMSRLFHARRQMQERLKGMR